MQIQPLKAFTDNYIWVLFNDEQCWAVDPGDANAVRSFLDESSLSLTGILITHHHHDHTGGVDDLASQYEDITIYGPAGLPIHTQYTVVSGDQELSILGTTTNVINTPGHTLDHIAYAVGEHLFCGDTLFSAGCGRLFEGTAEMMHASLNKLTKTNTKWIYPTHEYTLANLAFAAHVDPDNLEIRAHIKEASAKQQRNEPTLPTTWELELSINPFLRCNDTKLRQQVNSLIPDNVSNPVELFAQIRTLKDRF